MFGKLKIWLGVAVFLLALPVLLALGHLYRRARRDQLIKRALRISPAGLQLATLTFEKPDQNQLVRVFGMVHVGQEQYYQDILRELEASEQAGAQIAYERLRPLTDQETEQLSAKDRQVLTALQSMQQRTHAMAQLVGLHHQMDILTPQESWVNTDASLRDFLNYIHENRLTNFVLKQFGQVKSLSRFSDNLLTTLFFYLIARSQVLVILFGLLLVLPKMRKLKEFILRHRNQVGVDGIMQALQTHNRVDATWDAAHLPGMADLLAEQGFALIDVEWRTAFTFKKESFSSVARAIGQASRESLRREFSLNPEQKGEDDKKSD